MPRFYAACLASYNAGTLHGTWIDALTDVDAMQEEINAMLRASPAEGAEEWAVHDYDGIPSGFGEHPSLDTIAAFAMLEDAAETHGVPLDVAAQLIDTYTQEGTESAVDQIEDEYQGAFDSLADWAEDFEDSTGGMHDVPERLRGYINFAAIGRDAENGGNIRAIRSGGSLYVFWNR